MLPELVIFDMDGTLTESKSTADAEMIELVKKLLEKTKIAVISGGGFSRFHEQFLVSFLIDVSGFDNLYLAALNGGTLYSYHIADWKKVYEDVLSEEEIKKIYDAFKTAFTEIGFVQDEKIYGTLIEDRIGQVTFSGLGSEAPLEVKRTWDPDRKKRLALADALKKHLPDFEIGIGGMTSIDVSRKGIDKAYGVEKLAKFLSIPVSEMVFIGDALFPGGNDQPVVKTGIKTISVTGPDDTKKIIKKLLAGEKV
ncbi:MAG: HAD-IIB family hydrolase [Patescibacteria group bacterium]